MSRKYFMMYGSSKLKSSNELLVEVGGEITQVSKDVDVSVLKSGRP